MQPRHLSCLVWLWLWWFLCVGTPSASSALRPSSTTTTTTTNNNRGLQQQALWTVTGGSTFQQQQQQQQRLRGRLRLPRLAATTGSSELDDDDDDNSNNGSNQQHQHQHQQLRRRNISVATLLAVSFLNLLGFTVAGPITPALGRHFALDVGVRFGSLTSAYPLGMLAGLFLWPTLSDRVGRKPVLAASLLGGGLGLAAQALVVARGGSLVAFLTARAATGAFAGSSPVSKAYLADVGYRDGRLPRYLAWRDAASTMAFIVGPVLGGGLYELRRRWGRTAASASAAINHTTGSLSFVIGVSAAASLLAAAMVMALVQDVKPKPQNTTDDSKSNSENEDEETREVLIACPLGNRMWTGVASVCVVSGLFNAGDATFHAFFSALLRDRGGLGAADIGLVYTGLACVSLAVSTSGVGVRLLRRSGPVATCVTGLTGVATGLLALGAAAVAGGSAATVVVPKAVLVTAAAVYYCGVPLYGPTIPTMLLQCMPGHRRGSIMGLDGAINTLGRIISPLAMGEVYRRRGAGAAFGLAGGVVFVGALTALLRRFIVLRGSFLDTNDDNTTGRRPTLPS